MAWDVYLSPMADRQVQSLRRRRKKAYEDFLDDLEQRGCAALDYRLTGPAPIDSVCIKHLTDPADAMGQLAVVLLALFAQMERTYTLGVGQQRGQAGPVAHRCAA